MSTVITTIAFDADDTLWHNERLFRFTEAQFADLLRDYADKETLECHLLEIEKRNLHLYGYGIKGFTLSMIETAIEVTQGRVPTHIIKTILDAGQTLHRTSIEVFPHVRSTLLALHGLFKLIVITKGDLFDQERKLAESNLGDLFDAIEVVTEKDKCIYEKLFNRHGTGADQAVMVGNSLKSDIIPALESGAFGIYVPYDITWILEQAEEPVQQKRYQKIESLADLPALLPILSSNI